jgi:single-strand DNA-binding protein
MSEGLNSVHLLGNLGADPELRTTQGGAVVLKLRLATTQTYLDRNRERQERTEWHSVVIWGKRAEALGRILNKGDRIFVEGSNRTSSYDDRENVKRYKTEVVAGNIILCGNRRQGTRPEDDRQYPAGDDEGPAYDDEIPF